MLEIMSKLAPMGVANFMKKHIPSYCFPVVTEGVNFVNVKMSLLAKHYLIKIKLKSHGWSEKKISIILLVNFKWDDSINREYITSAELR